jgi:4-amino-4-deoxy-L-arabinose transferase-like glycosyltransferase
MIEATTAQRDARSQSDRRPATRRLRTDVILAVTIAAAAFAPRLYYAARGPHSIIWADQGGIYTNASYLAGLPPRYTDTPRRAWGAMGVRGPVYYFFVAGLIRCAPDNGATLVRYVQAGLGACTSAFLFVIALQLASRRAGIVAGLLHAVCPTFIVYTGKILTETLAVFLLWAGIAILVRALRCGRWHWYLTAAAACGLAGLTRPTLLPLLPLAALAILAGAAQRRMGARVVRAAAFCAVVLALILGWKLYAHTVHGVKSIVGAGGMRVWVAGWSRPTNPAFRGWFPDRGAGAGIDEPWLENVHPAYLPAAAANLVLCHLWYADTSWIGTWFLPHEAVHAFNRGLVLLGLGGLGIGFARPRTYALMLLLAGGLPLISVKWIELRHALPALAMACVFGGVFVAEACQWVSSGRGRWHSVAALLGSLLLTAVALWGIKPLVILRWFPSADPVGVGVAGDAAVVVLSLAWGVVLTWLARPHVGRARGAVAGFTPACVFAVLFACYAYVGSDPRWRAWQWDLVTTPAVITQKIQLPSVLSPDEVESAAWLVDLESSTAEPALRVALNGVWEPAEPALRGVSRLEPESNDRQKLAVYHTVSRCVEHEVFSWPQWWVLPVGPEHVTGREWLSLALALDQERLGRPTAERIRLGGSFREGSSGRVFGPGMERSLYRWPVLGDWRIWQTRDAAPVVRRSSVRPAVGPDTDEPATDRLPILARPLESGQAQFHIRLWIRYQDGREVLF